MRKFERVAVYCGSSSNVDSTYLELAAQVGIYLATEGITVVYGGATVGTMGVVAQSALQSGGRVIGVITEHLKNAGVAAKGLTKLHVVNSMQGRKRIMFELADAFIALPGGFGTLDEIMEVATLNQVGKFDKPVGMLNRNGYFDGIQQWVQRATGDKFIRPVHTNLITFGTSPQGLLESLRDKKPVDLSWMEENRPG